MNAQHALVGDSDGRQIARLAEPSDGLDVYAEVRRDFSGSEERALHAPIVELLFLKSS